MFYLGVAYLIITVIAGWFMQNPPVGYEPAGWKSSASLAAERSTTEYSLGEALNTWQWWALWLLLFLNTSAGISLISQESPIFQDLSKVTSEAGRRNGRHRSDRQWAWAYFLGLGIGCCHAPNDLSDHVCYSGSAVLVSAEHPYAHADDSCEFHYPDVLRGGFGTMPAFAADYFGPKNVGSIYGLMLTAWGFASAFGPLLIAKMRETSGTYSGGLHAIAGVLLVSMVLPFVVRPPRPASIPQASPVRA